MDLSGGYFSELPLVRGLFFNKHVLSVFTNLKFIDLSSNRVALNQTNYDQIKSLTVSLAKKRGAVIITSNPVATIESHKFFTDWVLSADEESFYHLIWIPDFWVGSKGWGAILKITNKTKLDSVEDNVRKHHAIYYNEKAKQKK